MTDRYDSVSASDNDSVSVAVEPNNINETGKLCPILYTNKALQEIC